MTLEKAQISNIVWSAVQHELKQTATVLVREYIEKFYQTVQISHIDVPTHDQALL